MAYDEDVAQFQVAVQDVPRVEEVHRASNVKGPPGAEMKAGHDDAKTGPCSTHSEVGVTFWHG